MLHHSCNTPTFKLMRFFIKGGLLLLYKQLVTHFPIFHLYDTPTFKPKALRLVSNEGWVKGLLLLYRRLIQPHLSLLGCNWRCISLVWPRLLMTLTTRAIKQNSRNFSTNHLKSKLCH